MTPARRAPAARPRSLAFRLTVAYALIALLGIASVAAVAAVIIDHGYFRTLQAGLTDQARFAATALRPALDRQATAGAWPPACLEADTRALAAGLDTRLTIIAADGAVLGDSWEDAATMVNHADRPEVQAALRGATGINRRRSATVGQRLFYLAIPVNDATGQTIAVVRVAKIEEVVATSLAQLLWAVTGTAIVAMAAALVIAAYLSRRIAGPLQSMREAAERIASGDLGTRVYGAGEGEVGQLAEALNAMAGQLQQRLGELEEANGRSQALLANMASGVVLIDDAGRMAMVNPIALDWLELAGDVVGKPYTGALRWIDLLEAVRESRASGRPERVELRLTPGNERVVSASLTPVAGGRGGVVIVLNDVSEAKRMARLRSEFIANLSHQFKTPVAVIKGYVETLLDGALADPATAREFLTITRDEADRLAWLVSQVLELARLEDPNLLLDLAEADLRDVVGAAGQRFRPAAERDGLTLEVALPDDPAPICCDRTRIEEAVANLLDNARKHSPARGTIRLELTPVREAWRIAVSDQGAGIPEAVLPRIFERFYRGPGAPGGTGLGLAIVKHVAEVHGGRAWATNRRDGRGAAVGIDLAPPAQPGP